MGDNPFEVDDDDNPFADKGGDDYNPFDDSMFDKKVQALPSHFTLPSASHCCVSFTFPFHFFLANLTSHMG